MTNLEGRVILRQQAVAPPAGVRDRPRGDRRAGRAARVAGAVRDRPRGGLRRAGPGVGRAAAPTTRASPTTGSAPSTASSGRARTPSHPGTPRLFLDAFATPTAGPGSSPSSTAARPRPSTPSTRSTSRPAGCSRSTSPARRPGGSATCPTPARSSSCTRCSPTGSVPATASRSSSRPGAASSRRRPGWSTTIRPDTVFVPFHWVGANRLTNDALDPSSRMPEFKVCAAAVTRAGRGSQRPRSRSVWSSVGNGMAAARLRRGARAPTRRLDDRAASPCSATSRTRRTTGSCCRPCSRARTTRRALALAARVVRRRRRPAARRARRRDRPQDREVELADRTDSRYDELVLATGSIPTLPPIRGLVRVDGRLARRVHAFRTLDDCRASTRAVPGARRAVVVGGGLLGLEVARALGVRGLATEVVEGGDHLLRSQLDAKAGAILARDLAPARHHGLHRRPRHPADRRRAWRSTTATSWTPTWSCSPPAAARPRRWPAAPGSPCAAASSSTTSCATSDPDIYAIGDCAQHADRVTGFVPPAWEQAGGAGQASSTASPRRTTAAGPSPGCGPPASTSPCSATRVRAEGQVVEVSDPVGGTHRRLVVRDGVIVAATLVGDLSRIGLITQHFDRRTVLGPLRARRPAAAGDRPAEPPRPARRRRGLRLRRRQRRRDPRVRLARPTSADRDPGHHRLRRLRRHRPASPRSTHHPHPGRNRRMSPQLRTSPRRRRPRHGRPPLRGGRIERGLTETHDVVVIGEEPRPAYDRVALTSFFEVGADALSLLPDGRVRRPAGAGSCSAPPVAGSTRRPRPSCSTTDEVAAVRRARARHRLRPVRAAGAGHELPGCFVYRTIEDLEAIREAAPAARRSARSSAAGCSAWRPPTRCASWAWRRTSWRSRRG